MIDKEKIKIYARYAVYAVFFGALIAVGFDMAMRIITKTRRAVVTPDVTGMNIAAAMDALQKKGLLADKEKESSSDETIPAGSVVRQNPVAGAVVRTGRKVRLTLSEGGNLIYVPDICGRTLPEAEILLTRAGLAVGNVTGLYSDEVKIDRIIMQEPLPGGIVKPATMIDIAKSKGPASLMGFLVMPYYVGKSSSEASLSLNEMGFEIAETEEMINNNIAPGTIIKQEPAPGDMLSKDSFIKFFISQLSREENVQRTVYIYWEVPQDIKERDVKIIVKDAVSRRTVYEKAEQPGKKISLEVEVIGEAYAIFHLDGTPVARKDI
ncbi:PASTA domain-containing protein [bacterium]|nr:PASTA domain-containing protein [bacterium]MBU3956551.1 PASTA domain-containing protein [bacterium]MBU4134449.1 PASTA domain-containing protein [bacterium]